MVFIRILPPSDGALQVRKISGPMSRRNGKSFWCTWPATTNGKKRCLGRNGKSRATVTPNLVVMDDHDLPYGELT